MMRQIIGVQKMEISASDLFSNLVPFVSFWEMREFATNVLWTVCQYSLVAEARSEMTCVCSCCISLMAALDVFVYPACIVVDVKLNRSLRTSQK